MKKTIFFIILTFLFIGFIFAEENAKGQPPEIKSLRLSFINEAYKYLNTPYKYAGISKVGIDCSGLIYKSALDSLNKALPRSASAIAKVAKKIENSDIQPGDLLFFNTFGNKVSHVAIYIGEGEFIHSASAGPKTGVIISSLTESYWKKCYLFAGRILPAEKNFE